MMTYKEYIKYQMDRLGGWQRFWMHMASNPPPWRIYYYEYVLRCIAKSKDLEEAKETVAIALGDGEEDKAHGKMAWSCRYINNNHSLSPEFRKFWVSIRSR